MKPRITTHQDEVYAYYFAILEAIGTVADRHPDGADMGHVCGALASAISYLLSGIEDPVLRGNMLGDMINFIADDVLDRIEANRMPHIEIVERGNRDH